MKKYSFIFLLSLLFCCFSVSAQTKHIEGNLIDTTENKGIKNAKVILINLKDSVIINHKTTDENGHFIFSDFSLETFRMIVEHPKYETREFYFLEENPEEKYVLNRIVMAEKGKQIDEITIFAYKDPVYYRGDTLVYIADSFKTRPNAVVEDLLKRLPGITVESDGSIKSQGKNVSRVYVDGDEFFGSDATLATKNLAASSVETVNVYETTLPDAEAGDEKVQVIDLKLKDEAKKGYFGKASFASDAMNFYEGQLLANRFNKKQKISAFFLSGNTTRASISWSDANQYGIQTGNAYNYNAETDSWEANDNFINTSEGFPLIFRTGLYFTDQVTKKLKIGANYTYNDFRKETEETSRSTFFLPDTTYSSHSLSRTNTHFKHHEANINFRYDIDSTQFITFDPKFNFSIRKNEDFYQSDFLNQNNQSVRNAINTNNSDVDATNIKTRLGYTKNFKKEKRQLRVLNNFIYDKSNSSSDLLYNDLFTQTNMIENGIDQQKNSQRAIVSNVFNIVYVEPLSKRLKMEFSYELFNSTNTQNSRSLNRVNDQYSDLDSLTSGDFKSIKFQNRIGATLIYDYKKHILTIGAFGRNVAIDNQNHFIQSTIKQNVTDFLPKITYNYKINKNSSLRLNSQTTSTLPNIGLLQPVRDNSNPNSIFVGNENLRPNYAINNSLNFNTYRPLSGAYFYGGIYSEYGFNQFISTLDYDSIGRIINSYTNGNTLNYLGAYASGGIPLIKHVLSLNPSVQYNYGNRYNYVNAQRNALNTHGLDASLELALYADVVEFSFGVGFEHRQNINSISPNLNLKNTTYGLESELRVYLPWNMEIGSDFEYRNYNNLSDEFNINTFILNADIEQNLGKNKNWSIAFQAFDILNQNTKIMRGAFANRVTDNRKLVISRYFMLSLTYKFNSTYKKTKGVNETNETDE
jgi:hypothetical protein